MLGVRRTLTVFVATWVVALAGSWLLRGLDFVGLDLPTGVRIAALVVCALVGLAAGLSEASEKEPWSEDDLRDGALGWGIVGALVAGGSCLFLPAPWSVVAAVGAVVLVAAGATYLYRAAPRLAGPSDEAAAH